jgi:tetratricopeptide (TPR) repeat protein
VAPLVIERWSYAGPILVAVTVVLVFGLIYGRHFFLARFLGSKKLWHEAIAHYETFESRAKKLNLGRLTLPLFLSVYTYDGVALAKNNMAFCYMNLRVLDQAKRLCLEALEIDSKYAVPHVNLGIIAALQNDAATAAARLERGYLLGYRNQGAQEQVRRILARLNVAAGSAMSDERR